jgi:dihydroorotate dehydrogenase electron transfer subunit
MIQTLCPVTSIRAPAPEIKILSFRSPEIASSVQPGQFINIRVNTLGLPLLRRPFSVYTVEGAELSIIFSVVGTGTRLLAEKRPGDLLDIIGPLGNPFRLEGDFTTGILLAGGLGVAPLPLLTRELLARSKRIVTLIGARTAAQLVTGACQNIHVATEDGSAGLRGTVLDLLRSHLKESKYLQGTELFGCGPTAMLKNLSQLAGEMGLSCQISLEGSMACGIGICQGCPVALSGGSAEYALICKDGPVFESRKVLLE